MNNLDLKEQTKNLCKQLDIVPTKSKGQNFLISQGVLDKIITTADLSKEDVVLEIGPGLGILTEELTKRVGRVVAVELDRKLLGYLKDKFGQVKNLELVEGDVIKLLNYQIVKLLEGKKYKVVANLPYQITSHVLRLLLETDSGPSEMVLMVQKEVGERICATKGEMSVLAVMVQYYSRPEMVAVVGREDFWPVPEVDSAIIKLKTQNSKLKSKEDLFFKFIKVGFNGKRKMLKNNLRNIYSEQKVLAAFWELKIDSRARAEDLGVEEWKRLYQKLVG
ncbi:ribosomal RNA small subunit methyltransferase A [Candidatus Kuenenbacteria bacterium]|nr:ribosomal RNA small subunit methyltransferase A [Candidatus Kuenenbacteria bacterium]